MRAFPWSCPRTWSLRREEARLEDAIIDRLTTQGGFIFVDFREGGAQDRYEKAFEGLVIDRMEGNDEIFGKLMKPRPRRELLCSVEDRRPIRNA